MIVNELGERKSRARGWTRLIVEKPFGHDLRPRTRSTRRCSGTSRSARSSGSTTTSARRRSRTCWRCGSRTASSSRSGTASSSTTSRSPSPSRSASRGAAAFYEQRGRDPRHLPEPPAAAPRADRDGAADRLHGRLGAEREGEGAALAAHAGAEVGRARPVRARVRRGRRGAGLPRGGGRRRPTRRPRRSSRRSSTSTTGAGRTRRSTSGRASGSRGARRRSRSSSSARRTRRSPRSRATGCGRTCS